MTQRAPPASGPSFAMRDALARLRREDLRDLTDRQLRTEATWMMKRLQNKGYVLVNAELLHAAIVAIDTRGCGGTHLMGYGFCQQLLAALQEGTP